MKSDNEATRRAIDSVININAAIRSGNFTDIQVKALESLHPLVFDANIFLLIGDYIYGERCYAKIAKTFKMLGIPMKPTIYNRTDVLSNFAKPDKASQVTQLGFDMKGASNESQTEAS